MAQGSQRQDDPRRDREVAHRTRPGAASGRRIRITVPVPPVAEVVLNQAGKDVSAEIDRVVAAFFRKLTPTPCKSPYSAELSYVERVLKAPTETLTPGERAFVFAYRSHEAYRELLAAEELSEATRRKVEEASEVLGDLVDAFLEVVRAERGEGTNELEWEITRP